MVQTSFAGLRVTAVKKHSAEGSLQPALALGGRTPLRQLWPRLCFAEVNGNADFNIAGGCCGGRGAPQLLAALPCRPRRGAAGTERLSAFSPRQR